MIDGFVLDASVTLAWMFEDETNEFADRVQDRIQISEVIAPAIWPLETLNAVLMAERRGRLLPAKRPEIVRRLRALPINVDSSDRARTFDSIMPLAVALGVTTYDASYLELALRRSLPLATIDQRMTAAASAAGVPLFTP